MRVHCDVCERNLAAVMCCADEAALCTECDLRVHAANKLASKHQRVPLLLNAYQPPKCDICQEKTAFFFCQEDRAVLCRDCDVSIHSSNHLAAGHARFLLTGARVALEALSPEESTSLCSLATDDDTEAGNLLIPGLVPQQGGGMSVAISSRNVTRPTHLSPGNRLGAGSKGSSASSSGGSFRHGSGGGISGPSSGGLKRNNSGGDMLGDGGLGMWGVDELLNIPELADGYSLGDIASSKADAVNLDDYDWAADLSLFDEQVYVEGLHEVPQMPDPSSSRPSKLTSVKGKSRDYGLDDDLFLVPDLGLESAPESPPHPKRRRNYY
eukprot:TRINITY_DN16233_c0_g1_i1.p1 TRINITY_DN16233_c0_g1~~TRINITY_DN16233_c0_g1_i1.p1  ORF type:complete len:325 (+),score=62.11 TRINITY_DN16233_c0_g1_i1:151-1125(+)